MRCFITFVMLLSLAAGVSGASKSDAVATVDGVQITKDDHYQRMYQEIGKNTLEIMINEKLISAQAESKKITVTPEELNTRLAEVKARFADEAQFLEQLKTSGINLVEYKKQAELEIKAEKLIADNYGIKVTTTEAGIYFTENKDRFGTPEQVRVKHILVSTEQEAKDLILAIKAGANFETLAKAKSLDPASREKGGDIGFFTKGMLIPEFEKSAFELKPGEYSDVIRTKLGFHILQAVERKPAEEAKFEAVADSIRVMIFRAKINQARPEYMTSLRQKAKIELKK